MTPEAAQALIHQTYRSFVDAGIAFKALADRGDNTAAVDALLDVHEAGLRLVDAEKEQLAAHIESRAIKSQTGDKK